MKESKAGRKSVPADATTPQFATAGQTPVPDDPLAHPLDDPLVRIDVLPEHAGVRLDQFLVSRLPEVSRVRVQQLLEQRKILLNGGPAKPSLKLKGGERIEIVGQVQPAPLRAIAEDIPLEVAYEDRDLAVINKPAGMLVHAGAGTGDDPRNRGTLVNALLHRFGTLSETGGDLRPGIVHRLDKDTSGLLVVAKNDFAHRKLSEQFSSREIGKRYLGLVHGWPKAEAGTISAAIGRDRLHRKRMTTRGTQARHAVSHYQVLERLASPYGRFALLEVKIETGRTHQIRVHLSSIGHPIVGDTLYGAPQALSPHGLTRELAGAPISLRTEARKARAKPSAAQSVLTLPRNFLHSAEIEFTHPRTGKRLRFQAPLPADLEQFLRRLRRADSS
jgi:23S rRNA pseudouridine1911/1915/1917 synthase